MGNNLETFDAKDLERITNEIDTKCDEILEAIKVIDSEIEKVFITQGSENGLTGKAANKIVNLWDNNSDVYNGFDPVFKQWVFTLRKVYANNADFESNAAKVYADEIK